MASRPTQRNTKRIYARPGTEPNGNKFYISILLLPVAAAVAIFPRAVRAISPRVIHAVSPRAVRAISPRGQNAPRIACVRVRTASSSAPSSQPAA